MAKLDGLIRLHSYQLDEKKKELGELNTLLTSQETALENLHAERKREEKFASSDPTLLMSFSEYLKAFKIKDEKIRKAIKRLEEQIEQMREQVREAFAELKKFEIIQRRREEEAAAKQAKAEAQELDEIGLENHRRKEDVL